MTLVGAIPIERNALTPRPDQTEVVKCAELEVRPEFAILQFGILDSRRLLLEDVLRLDLPVCRD